MYIYTYIRIIIYICKDAYYSINMCCPYRIYIYGMEGSLKVKLPTIWADEKAEVGRVKKKKKKEGQRKERVRRKKMQVREKAKR